MSEPLNLKNQQKERKKTLKQERTDSKQSDKQNTDLNQIKWTALEFTKYQKNKGWLLLPGVVFGGIFIWAIIAQDFLFAIVVALSYFLIAVYAFKDPDKVKISITPRGVKINQTLYPYENLESFWIFYEPPETKEISIKSKKNLMPYITIPLGEKNPAKARRVLIKYLDEEEHEESALENLAKFFKF